MTQKPRKIHIATEDEVRQYAASSEPAAPPREPASAPGESVAAPAEPTTPLGETDVTATQQPDRLPGLEKELEETRDRLLRAKADCQNLIRRTAREKSDAIRFATEGLVRSLLPVVDGFERTLQAAADRGGDDPIAQGVRLVHESLMKVLRDHQVTGIEAEGKPFDPHVHNVATQEPSKDHPPGTVIRQLARGYMLHDRVLRAAHVVVAVAPMPLATRSDSPPAQEAD